MKRASRRLVSHFRVPFTAPVGIMESYRPQHPRILFFHFLIAMMAVVLASGLAYRQIFRSGEYGERERLQNQRRVLVPGPRGNIYDRNGRLLVGNRPRFAVTLHLDELRREFRAEYIKVVRQYREGVEAGVIAPEERPSSDHLEQIARAQVVQRYLNRVNQLLRFNEKVNVRELERHFQQQLVLPYVLVDDLKPEEYARLIEQLPVESPLQVYTSSTRYYPYGPAAAHVLGYVGMRDVVTSEAVPGDDLRTYALKSTFGRDGLESRFDSQLQGGTGGIIFRVDPAGFRVNPPLDKRMPVKGRDLFTSLDIDLQLAAEQAADERAPGKVAGIAALDVATGEVLVLASKPGYDLNDFSPRLSSAAVKDINERGAWTNYALQGVYPPGSTFKLATAIAGLRSGSIAPGESTVDCKGSMAVGNRVFYCDNGNARHGPIAFTEAVGRSCDVFFYTYGGQTTADVIAAEARRFHLDRPTGIELPHEVGRMLIPDTAWKKKTYHEPWFPGDTANMAIGQGFIGVTPLQMACFVASLARGETVTRPTLIHDSTRQPQHSEPIGLTPDQYHALVSGMEGCTTYGTASWLTTMKFLRIPGLRIAGKTGTAQTTRKGGEINIAWFVCFAPVEDPAIAIAVAIEGDTSVESYSGGRFAAPVAQAVLKKWFEKTGPAPASLASGGL